MSDRYSFEKLEHFLSELGLTPKQARVYLATLQLGTATVQQIATEAKTERTNAYDAIKALIAQRLMSTTNLGKKRLFAAEPPETLENILAEKQATLKHLLPELRSLYNISDAKPRIRYYPGLEGYKAVYEDTLTSTSKLLFGVYSVQDLIDVLGKEYTDHMVERRVKARITFKVVRSQEREIPYVYPPDPSELRVLRFAPKGIVFPIATLVYDNKVIYLSSKKETFGLIIESPDVALAHKNYFEALWQISSEKIS